MVFRCLSELPGQIAVRRVEAVSEVVKPMLMDDDEPSEGEEALRNLWECLTASSVLTKDQLPQLKSTGFWMEAREGERLGSEEWKHLDRVCKEVAPEEQGEGGSEPEEEVKNEEVRLTARGGVRLSVGSEGEVSQEPGRVVESKEQGRSGGHFSVVRMLPQVD